MTDATQQALVIAAAPTLLALGTLITSIINTLKANRVLVKADVITVKAVEASAKADQTLTKADTIIEKATDTVAKADTIIEKAVEIHTLTNSNLSKVTAALEVALAKIEGLQKLVASMNETKAVTADANKREVAVALGTPVPSKSGELVTPRDSSSR